MLLSAFTTELQALFGPTDIDTNKIQDSRIILTKNNSVVVQWVSAYVCIHGDQVDRLEKEGRHQSQFYLLQEC